MDESADTLFIEMAVAKGLLTRDQADEAAEIQRLTEGGKGSRRPLREAVVEEGWMTPDEVAEVEAQIEDGSEQTGKIEGYKLLAKIGQGGMGAVYKAERVETGEIVALKVLPRRMAQREQFVGRFLREARAAAKMTSAYIVRPVDVGFSGGYYYFAMEFVEGESVDTTLSIDGSMSELKALRIVRQMALALCDAESAGMVHRDIKPGNIIVSEDGVAKLTDFGLAREVSDDSVTQAGVTLGTPNYMSPEQAKAMKSLDTRSDIYSLGVTFYNMVTGSVPFHGETSLLTMLKHLNEQPVAPITRRPDLSQGCNDIILKMLAKNRDERYQKARELVEDIELVIEGRPPKHAECTAPAEAAEEDEKGVPDEIEQFAEAIRRQGRLRWIRIGAQLFGLSLVGVVVYALFFTGDGTPEDDGKKDGARRKTGAVPLTELGKRARARLAEAEAFALQHQADRDKLVEIVRRFADVRKEFAHTAVADPAGRQLAEYRRKLAKAVARELARCKAKADRLADKNRFGDAVEVYRAFAPGLRSEAVKEIEKAELDLVRGARKEFSRLEQEAERFLGAGEPAAARAIINEAVDTFGIEGIVSDGTRLLERIAEQEAFIRAETTRRGIEAYQAVIKRIAQDVRAAQFPAALSRLRRAAQPPAPERVRKMLATDRRNITVAREVWALVERGAGVVKSGWMALVAETPDGKKTLGMLLSYDRQNKLLKFAIPGGKPERKFAHELPGATLARLARAGSGDKVSALKLATFFIARGEYPLARKELVKAKAGGAAPAALAPYEEQLRLVQKEPDAVTAEDLLAEAQKRAAAGEHGETARLLRVLVARFSHTPCYAEHRETIKEMLARAGAGTVGIDSLFAVRLHPLPGGRTELKYDFSGLGQGGDWKTGWKERSLGSWQIRVGPGEMKAESGRVYFKVPFRGDYEVHIQVKDVETAVVRLGVPDPSAAPGAGGCSVHWKRQGDGAVATCRKAGKTLEKDEAARIQLVGTLTLLLEVKAGAVTLQAADRTLRVPSAKKPIEPDRPGYLVLDGFTPGARVTSAVLRCTLDSEWLERELLAPLRDARRQEALWRLAKYQPLLVGSNASGWRTYQPGGKWAFVKGVARATARASCVMTTGDMNWRDYALSTQVKLGAGAGSARVMARWTDPTTARGHGRGYYVELTAGRGARGAGGEIALRRALGGPSETLKAVRVPIPGLAEHAVYLEVRGDLIRVRLNGREVLRARNAAHPQGKVGVASHLCGARFGDIKIKHMK